MGNDSATDMVLVGFVAVIFVIATAGDIWLTRRRHSRQVEEDRARLRLGIAVVGPWTAPSHTVDVHTRPLDTEPEPPVPFTLVWDRAASDPDVLTKLVLLKRAQLHIVTDWDADEDTGARA